MSATFNTVRCVVLVFVLIGAIVIYFVPNPRGWVAALPSWLQAVIYLSLIVFLLSGIIEPIFQYWNWDKKNKE